MLSRALEIKSVTLFYPNYWKYVASDAKIIN